MMPERTPLLKAAMASLVGRITFWKIAHAAPVRRINSNGVLEGRLGFKPVDIT